MLSERNVSHRKNQKNFNGDCWALLNIYYDLEEVMFQETKTFDRKSPDGMVVLASSVLVNLVYKITFVFS